MGFGCLVIGKLLVDGMTLRESEITNGSKIMLMASQGLHQGVILSNSTLFLSRNLSFNLNWEIEFDRH